MSLTFTVRNGEKEYELRHTLRASNGIEAESIALFFARDFEGETEDAEYLNERCNYG